MFEIHKKIVEKPSFNENNNTCLASVRYLLTSMSCTVRRLDFESLYYTTTLIVKCEVILHNIRTIFMCIDSIILLHGLFKRLHYCTKGSSKFYACKIKH